MVRSQRLAAVDVVVVEAAERRAQHAVAVVARLLPKILTLRRKLSRLLRLLRQLRRLRPVPLLRLAAHRLAAAPVLPARLPLALHLLGAADAEARCQRLPVPAAHPRAAASPTGPAMARSLPAS